MKLGDLKKLVQNSEDNVKEKRKEKVLRENTNNRMYKKKIEVTIFFIK